MYGEAIVILGCGVDAAGMLSEDAKNSVRLGIEASKGKQETCCMIMTGYVSYKADFTPSISEAQAMKDYARSLGVPQSRVFVETESKDSLGNLLFTKLNLLLPLGVKDLTIVRGPNQSTERIHYLAQKVLGDTYTFEIAVPTIQRPDEKVREDTSLAMAKQWLEPIADGDTDAIYHLLRTKHPGYNSALGLDKLQNLL